LLKSTALLYGYAVILTLVSNILCCMFSLLFIFLLVTDFMISVFVYFLVLVSALASGGIHFGLSICSWLYTKSS